MNHDPNLLADLLMRARQALAHSDGALPGMPPATADAGCVVFMAIGEGGSRARVASGRGADVGQAWQQAARAIAAQALRAERPPQRLRAELVDRVTATTWGALKAELAQTKRNYFNEGIAFDARFETALLAQEMHGSAILYNGAEAHAEPNPGNLHHHTRRRFGREIDFPLDDAAPVWRFTTRAVYVDAEGAWPLTAEGQAAGYRTLADADWTTSQVRGLIDRASAYLAAQVKPSGEFHYGWFPCFDRAIPTYNTLRHASSTYALLEAWELTRDEAQKAAIDRSLALLAGRLIRLFDAQDGTRVAFLVDVGDEIKLGGNAVCLLAFVKYTELTGDAQYKPLMAQLALGIRHMQDPATGRFVHVLQHPGLQVKDAFRVIYYDGEAAFGLMRLYGLTRDPRWLAMVEKAFVHFIAAEHWRAHDHWLSYCVNELTRYRPEPRYFAFGLRNVADYLDFVQERITTFPTLLELMMAAREMVQRLDADPALRPLLAGLDRARFDRALEHRARYLANGHFWPELAMFFRHPDRIAGSFFIKHHSFRVRIDDVEHYLSGYVAYLRMLQARAALPAPAAVPAAPPPASPLSSGVVAWGGDVNLARRQHYRLRELGGAQYMLGGIAALREADLRIVNLECVVASTGEQGVEKGEGGPYYYRARPEMLAVLTEAGIDAVATANNHSGDYGPDALMEQQGLLDAAGIAHAGSGPDLDAALRPAFCRAGGVRVALFSLDATQSRFAAAAGRAGSAWLPLTDPGAWTATLAPRIAAARRHADVVLVAVHWGANLETAPSPEEIAVGHAIVDAGADAVLGASAHVLQGIEVYRGRPILHDAGDLLFDAVRNGLEDAGVFSLTLGPRGVEQVVFTPVGVGFGFSRQRVGEEAEAASARFAQQCLALGTEMLPMADGRCVVRLSPPERAAGDAGEVSESAAPSTAPPRARGIVAPVAVPRPEWWVDEVPADARMRALQFGPLRLLGVRCAPRQIVGRRMLWVESFWTLDAPTQADLRVQFRALPMRSTRMPPWGEGMDHDPCDWMWPTSRWEPGRIYRDRYGLRPPRAGLLESDVLRIEVRVLGGAEDLPAQRLPMWCGLRVPDFPTPLPERPAPVLAALRPGAGGPPSPVWTAEQLQRATGGRWLVEPPPGWCVNSVVRGPLHMKLLPAPALFVASDYQTLAAHENYSKPRPSWDRHFMLPQLQHEAAGAVVAHPVDGLDPAFPLLQVDDPIRALIALGAAARARYQGFVVGVTGTVGKSSTIAMLRDLLPEAARVHTTVDNYNSRVGVPATLANLAADADVCILEMAQSGLWMDRGPISLMARPHVAILTEVGLSQTGQASTLALTAEFKSRIFLGLEPGGVAIVADHIPCLVQVVQAAARTAGQIWVVGPGPDANIRVLDTRPEAGGGCRVRIAFKDRVVAYVFPIASEGLVRNSTLAFAALLAMGFDADAACARMPKVRLPASVMQVHALHTRGGVHATLIDDSWNAEILSMRNAMAFVRTYRRPDHAPVVRKIGVLGRIVNLGDEAEAMHRSLAAPLLASGIQHLVTHGAEMRWLREEMPAELLGPHFEDAAQLTGYLGDFMRDGDLVLLKGDRDRSDFGRIPELLQKL